MKDRYLDYLLSYLVPLIIMIAGGIFHLAFPDLMSSQVVLDKFGVGSGALGATIGDMTLGGWMILGAVVGIGWAWVRGQKRADPMPTVSTRSLTGDVERVAISSKKLRRLALGIGGALALILAIVILAFA